MNTQEHIKNIYDILKDVKKRLTGVRQVGGVHNLLGIVHPDTDPASPPGVGSVIRGSAGNEWEELALGAAGEVLTVAGGNAAWQPGAGGGGNSIFEDNFNDESIYWAWVKRDNNAAKTITEAGTVISFHVDKLTVAEWWGASHSAPQLHLGAYGQPFVITTKISAFVPNDDCAAGLFIFNSDAAWQMMFMERAREDGTGLNGLAAWHPTAGVLASNAVVDMPIWLRMRVSGTHRLRSIIYFDYSIDGITFTNLTSRSNSGFYPGTYGTTVGLYVRNGVPDGSGANNQIDADFDLFTMEEDGGPG